LKILLVVKLETTVILMVPAWVAKETTIIAALPRLNTSVQALSRRNVVSHISLRRKMARCDVVWFGRKPSMSGDEGAQ